MPEQKSSSGLKKKELFGRLLDLIDQKFGTSSREHFHVYYPPDDCTDEDIKKAHQEYIRNGGDPDTPFFIVKYESATMSLPEEANVTHEENVEKRGYPKKPQTDRPTAPGQNRLRLPGLTNREKRPGRCRLKLSHKEGGHTGKSNDP